MVFCIFVETTWPTFSLRREAVAGACTASVVAVI
jgi:hypothetical protein